MKNLRETKGFTWVHGNNSSDKIWTQTSPLLKKRLLPASHYVDVSSPLLLLLPVEEEEEEGTCP